MKSFDIPDFYRSHLISKLKSFRKLKDPRKRDFSPSILDYGNMEVMLPRHFGFCYGVENAIEICYKALNDNPDKQVYLLSQMIHNQEVNSDLEDRGILFLQDTQGNELLSFDVLQAEDVVVIPAFGTTLEMLSLLKAKGVDVQAYNTTCPFVEKVWKRSNKLGNQEFTVVIHGKPKHEETRATFSHSDESAFSIVIKNMEEAEMLGAFVKGERSLTDFDEVFGTRCSKGFDPAKHLTKFGVVNQTTMLATETQAIADYLKACVVEKFGEENYKDHFADTRDTLCYATNDNQQATYGLLKEGADVAIVIGGYN
ncbi:MAG: 4-hydroxy-3-methylbut-2-enyl diphosphate reductase, partial [Flavobacteriales bacterium]